MLLVCLNNLFEIDLKTLSSFKIGISIDEDGGIWWSTEEKQNILDANIFYHGYCNFFSTQLGGWISTDAIRPANGYFAFDLENLIINSSTKIRVKLFLYYKN